MTSLNKIRKWHIVAMVVLTIITTALWPTIKGKVDPQITQKENLPLSFAQRSELILKLPPGPEKNNAMGMLAESWVTAIPEQAILFREKLKSSPKVRQAFDKSAMPHLSQTFPDLVLKEIQNGIWWQDQWKDEQLALSVILKGTLPSKAWQYLADSQGKQRASQLGGWLGSCRKQTLPCVEYIWKSNANKPSPLLDETMTTWIKSNQEECAKWLNQQSGDLREWGLQHFVKGQRPNCPEDALLWALTAEKSDTRLSCVKAISIVPNGSKALAPKFTELVSQSNLPETEKQLLLSLLLHKA